ncbi:MAG TPA: hypothetical protein VN328_07025, partial [Thermodesulfovibrionales bacterium]|nr:hypothetical protein [Thermodesulfovibrionales bacterium]
MTPHLVAEKNNAFPVIIEYAYFWMEQEQGKEVYDLLNTFTERGHKIRIEAQEKRQNTKGTKMKKMQRDRYMLEECDFSKGIRGKYATKAMTVITTIFVLCLFAGPAAAEEDCPLKGKWKSNEKATLEQMNKYGNVSEKQRKT